MINTIKYILFNSPSTRRFGAHPLSYAFGGATTIRRFASMMKLKGIEVINVRY
jgi:hypothetical protein